MQPLAGGRSKEKEKRWTGAGLGLEARVCERLVCHEATDKSEVRIGRTPDSNELGFRAQMDDAGTMMMVVVQGARSGPEVGRREGGSESGSKLAERRRSHDELNDVTACADADSYDRST